MYVLEDHSKTQPIRVLYQNLVAFTSWHIVMGREVCVPHVPSANQILIIVLPPAMLNHSGFYLKVE